MSATLAVAASSDAPDLQSGEGGSQPTLLLHPYRAEDGCALWAPIMAAPDHRHPSGAKDLRIERCDFDTIARLNHDWHSVLPHIGVNFGAFGFVAEYDGIAHAVAVWSRPIAANRLTNGFRRMELRRMAVAPYAPRMTASRFLSVMSRMLLREEAVDGLLSYQATDVHLGTMYRAAGWRSAGAQEFVSWNTHSRRRPDDVNVSAKVRWEYP